ncbi:hypothetical protein BH20ACT15_BH20ACT15_15680 [soil metagenome]
MPRWVGILALVASAAFMAFALYNLVEFATGDHDWPVGIVGAVVLSVLLFQASRRIENE